jgi:hypothetical protein
MPIGRSLKKGPGDPRAFGRRQPVYLSIYRIEPHRVVFHHFAFRFDVLPLVFLDFVGVCYLGDLAVVVYENSVTARLRALQIASGVISTRIYALGIADCARHLNSFGHILGKQERRAQNHC